MSAEYVEARLFELHARSCSLDLGVLYLQVPIELLDRGEIAFELVGIRNRGSCGRRIVVIARIRLAHALLESDREHRRGRPSGAFRSTPRFCLMLNRVVVEIPQIKHLDPYEWYFTTGV